MRRIFAIMVLVTVALVGQVPTQSIAEGWTLTNLNSDQVGISIFDSVGFNYVSNIESTKFLGNTVDRIRCLSYDDPKCSEDSGRSVNAFMTLGVCLDEEINCIEGLSIHSADSPRKNATFVRNLPGPVFPGSNSGSLPRGSTTSLWSAGGLNHEGGGDVYGAWAKVQLSRTTGSWDLQSFEAGVTPVSVVKRSPSDSYCMSYDEGQTCLHQENFAKDMRVAMRIRVSKDLTGWLKGRLEDPTFSVQPFNKAANTVDIEAKPTVVPRVSAIFSVDGYNAWLNKNLPYWNAGVGGRNTGIQADSFRGLEMVSKLREHVQDSATGLHSVWSFSSISGQETLQVNDSCLSDNTRLLGLITTNAMAYEGGAPVYDSGYLIYKVAGMHFAPDGKTANVGIYDLVMRSETARCLYGFTKAPISASISVTGGDGSTVATSLASEKDGWFHLGAYGFTFSDKVIKVKFTQASSAKKKTITIQCVSKKTPKVTKKVSGTAPKCPSGYLKK